MYTPVTLLHSDSHRIDESEFAPTRNLTKHRLRGII